MTGMIFEIWLGSEHDSHFDHGFVHEDGRSLPLEMVIHSASPYADSVLLADYERSEVADFPVRWFTYEDGLEFYCWDELVKSVVLHNESGKDLDIKGYGVLPAGERREYTKDGQKKN